jgi:hypothetical protein
MHTRTLLSLAEWLAEPFDFVLGRLTFQQLPVYLFREGQSGQSRWADCHCAML